jgi:hypothetical protein
MSWFPFPQTLVAAFRVTRGRASFRVTWGASSPVGRDSAAEHSHRQHHRHAMPLAPLGGYV